MNPKWRDYVRGMVLMLLAIVLLTIARCASAEAARPHRLHLSQSEARAYAYRVGGATLVAIISEESSLCVQRVGDDGTSLGCSQLKLGTARIFAPRITRWRLLHDDRLNIRIAWRYFLAAEAITGSWTGAVYAYNHGIPLARRASWHVLLSDPYVRAVRSRLREGSPK